MKMEHMRAVFNPICPSPECCNPEELVCAEMICSDNSQADAICNQDTCKWQFNCDQKSNFTKISFDGTGQDFIFAVGDSEIDDGIPNPEGEVPTAGKTETKHMGVIGKFLIGITVAFLFLFFVAFVTSK